MKVSIYQRFIKPRSQDDDSARRELILNTLLCGLSIVAFLAVAVTVPNILTGHTTDGATTLVAPFTFFVAILFCWYLSRRGWHEIINYVVIVCFGVLSMFLTLTWSYDLPMAEVCFGLMLVTAGVLLKAGQALRFAGFALIVLLTIAILQFAHVLHPNVSWLDQPLLLSDAIGYAIIFSAMVLVSWLANREVDRSLKRALASEEALAAERDSLEIKVVERTRELEQSQLLRLMELQRFAEFGRLSANLLHELSNPLTAVSINLEELRGEHHSRAVTQAHQNLQHLERYLEAARKQLKNQSELTTFSIHKELMQLKAILSPNAKKAGIELAIHEADNYRLYGDPVKFSQLLSNLISNAIEAYDNTALEPAKKKVEVATKTVGDDLIISVHDWGGGITSTDLPHIFEPFYSAKPTNKRSMGIGLAMVKQYVTEDFGGSIAVTSMHDAGTEFIVQLKHRKKPSS